MTISPTHPGAAPDPDVLPSPPSADPGQSLVVELRGVSKRFGQVPALSNLDLFVPEGRITVLLGPNGAGKTTAIRVITGALEPDSGMVRTFGYDPTRFGEHVRMRCGVVAAKPALYDRLSGWDNMQYSAELYGLGRNATAQIREAAGRFGILDALDQQVGGYSTGMKTRLALARSTLHSPDLLLFDEPTSGLDPESSHAVLEMIREMTDNGRTVVMCTHLLLEAEGLADTVVVMEDGRDLVAGTPSQLTRQFWPGTVVLVGAENPEMFATAAEIGGVSLVEPDSDPNRVRLHLDGDHHTPDVVRELVTRGVRLTRVELIEPSLEDLYFAVRTKKSIADDGGRQLTPSGAEVVTDRHRQVAALTGWPSSEETQ